MVQSNTITITVSGAVSSPTIASISISASTTSITAGQSVTISGTVLDSNGNGVSGDTVTLSDTYSGATALTTTTNSGGQYSFTITFPAAGTFSLYTVGQMVQSNSVVITVSGSSTPSQSPYISYNSGTNVLSGYGFTPNGAVSIYLLLDNGNTVGLKLITASSTGTISFLVSTSTTGSLGAVDVVTSDYSNSVPTS